MSAWIDDELRWMRKQLDSMIERMAPKPEPPPKPRECWAIFAEGKQSYLRTFGGEFEAMAQANKVFPTDEVVHMREVLPESEKTATEIAGGGTHTRIEELRRLLAAAQNILRAP